MYPIKFIPGLFLATVLVSLTFLVSSTWAKTQPKPEVQGKRLIGSTAMVEEAESDFVFRARVDTGATTSSLHVEDCKIEGEADEMGKNVGKTIRFRIKNQDGESEWLKRKISQISVIKTSEREERRYKVPMTLNCLNVKKRVLVSLNDRSHMTYPMLLGRNFLQGNFVVDVDLKNENNSRSKQLAKNRQAKQTPYAGVDNNSLSKKK